MNFLDLNDDVIVEIVFDDELSLMRYILDLHVFHLTNVCPILKPNLNHK